MKPIIICGKDLRDLCVYNSTFVQKYGLEKKVVFFATNSICTNKKMNIHFDALGKFSFEDTIIQNVVSKIGVIKEEIREGNLNADRKRFWLVRVGNINDKIMNESMPLLLNYF